LKLKPNVVRKGTNVSFSIDVSPTHRRERALNHAREMSESYQHVVKGGLKLKGGVPAAGGVKKKKKKKDKHKDVRGDARFRPAHDAQHRIPCFSPRTRTTRSDFAPSLVRYLRRKRETPRRWTLRSPRAGPSLRPRRTRARRRSGGSTSRLRRPRKS
jgi:hypothetical protein